MLRWLTWTFGRREPPIQALDSFDIVGERKDGGIDLMIVNSNPADGSSKTRRLLRQKIANYLAATNTNRFKEEYGFPTAEQTRIMVCCMTPPNKKVAKWVEEWKPWAIENGARLLLSVGVPH